MSRFIEKNPYDYWLRSIPKVRKVRDDYYGVQRNKGKVIAYGYGKTPQEAINNYITFVKTHKLHIRKIEPNKNETKGTFRELFNNYINNNVSLCESTKKEYSGTITAFLDDELDMRIDIFCSQEHLRNLYKRLSNDMSMYNDSKDKKRIVLGQIIKRAWEDNLIKMEYYENYKKIFNPLKGNQKTEPKKKRFYDPVIYYQNVIQKIDPDDYLLKPYLNLSFETGCRINELLALLVKDVDFTTNTVHITKSLSRENGGRTPSRTKTSSGVRDLTIGIETKEILKEHVKNLYLEQDDYLFPSKNNHKKPIGENTLNRAIEKHLIKCGVPKHLKTHAIRHMNTTIMYASNQFTPRQIADRLGQKDPNVSLNTYLENCKDDKAIANYMDSFKKNKGGENHGK